MTCSRTRKRGKTSGGPGTEQTSPSWPGLDRFRALVPDRVGNP
ncbi:MAG: hypothetical protein AB1416_02315 [Actinomycetota bacterium]